jgi:endo-1,4-beta-xylanase
MRWNNPLSVFICSGVLATLSACGGGSSSGEPKGGGPMIPPPSGSTPEQQVAEMRLSYNEVEGLRTLADFPIGTEVSAADQENSIFIVTDQQPVLAHHFSNLVAGSIMKSPTLHPQENEFAFDSADQLVDFALANNMTMHGHTLLWHRYDWTGEPLNPVWMENYTGDWDAMLETHVRTIVDHFANRVTSWDIVNEAVDYNVQTDRADYRDNIFYRNIGPEYIENAYRVARAADPEAQLYYNDYGLSDNGPKLNFTLTMLEDLLDRGVPIDGLGFQMHITLDGPSIGNIRAAFAKAATLGLMIKISELDIAINSRRTMPPVGWSPSKVLTAALALEQKKRYKEVVAAYLSAVPPAQRGGITVWGLTDDTSWMRSFTAAEWPLLFNGDYTTKPAFHGVKEALLEQQ